MQSLSVSLKPESKTDASRKGTNERGPRSSKRATTRSDDMPCSRTINADRRNAAFAMCPESQLE
eukprot:133726-Rhodomonas_salina.1